MANRGCTRRHLERAVGVDVDRACLGQVNVVLDRGNELVERAKVALGPNVLADDRAELGVVKVGVVFVNDVNLLRRVSASAADRGAIRTIVFCSFLKNGFQPIDMAIGYTWAVSLECTCAQPRYTPVGSAANGTFFSLETEHLASRHAHSSMPA